MLCLASIQDYVAVYIWTTVQDSKKNISSCKQAKRKSENGVENQALPYVLQQQLPVATNYILHPLK